MPPHRRNTKKTTSFKAYSHTGNQPSLFFLFRCHTGVIQNYKLAAAQAQYKVQARRPTGVILGKTTSFKLTATQATKLLLLFFSFSFSPPHRRNTKLQACCHTGVIQNNNLTATQATKLQACRHAGEIQKRQVYCNTGTLGTRGFFSRATGSFAAGRRHERRSREIKPLVQSALIYRARWTLTLSNLSIEAVVARLFKKLIQK